MKTKVALITSGGGTACSYGAGAVLALAQNFKFTDPDIVISGSGSTGAGSYYISRQYDSFRNIWLNLLCTKKFIDFERFWKIIDIDYLIDELFKKKEPLDVEKIYASDIHYLISATDHKSGNVIYFSNRKKDDIFEAMRASMAMPIVYNKVVNVKGKKCHDSYNSSCIQLNMLKAIKMGAKKLIVIDNEILNHLDEFGFDAWLKLQTKEFQKNYDKNLEKRIKIKLPKGVRVIFLRSKKPLKIGVFNNNKDMLKKTFDQGYKDTSNNKELISFVKKL
jgi:predicted patatin/cPLA2 family phospholipase